MIIVRPDKTDHWYYRNGKSCYEVPNKSKPGQMRATTLRDAKKWMLCPSVTKITRCWYSAPLERYKIEQAVLTALTMPTIEGESEADFLRRLDEDRKRGAQEAAEFGTVIHKCIEQYHATGICQLIGWGEKIESKLAPIMQGYISWADENIRKVLESEKSFAANGYGGKTDMLFSTRKVGRDVLCDFKSRDTKPDKKILGYKDMARQLAAYANGLGVLGDVKLWNVVVSRTEPGRIEVIDWTDQGQEQFEAFMHLFEVWCIDNKYDPRKQEKENADS